MQFSLKYLLALVTLVAVVIAAGVYASRLDSLALVIYLATLLTHVVLPAAAIGTAIGIWRRKARLAMISSGVLGGIVGLCVGVLLVMLIEISMSLLAEAGMAGLLDWVSSEGVALTVLPVCGAMGAAGGYWLTRRILKWRS